MTLRVWSEDITACANEFLGGKAALWNAVLHQVLREQIVPRRHEGRLPQLQDVQIPPQLLRDAVRVT